MTTETTIYERIGGADVVAEVVDGLYARVLDDPELSPFFANSSVAKIKRIQNQFIAAALDGPVTVSDIDLSRIHQGLGVTREHVTRFVEHLIAVLDSRQFISRTDAMNIVARIATYSDQVTGSAGGVDG